MDNTAWFVYIVECKDKSLYTGITNDLHARVTKHNAGTGAKYTRGRGPVKLLKSWRLDSKSEAAKEEHRIKRLKREEKLLLLKPIPHRKAAINEELII